MKEDKSKKIELDTVQKELHQKIEQIMGPIPEDAPPGSKQSADKPVGPEANKPEPEIKGAPEVGKVSTQIQHEAGPKPVQPPKPRHAAKLEAPETSDDPELDKAVDDIAAKESDEILKAEDDEVKKSFEPKPKAGFFGKVKNFIKELWTDPKKRKITISAAVLGLVVLAVVPRTRYFILNGVGVRSSASLSVVDEGTQQPLKNVTVTLDGQTTTTDDQGSVHFSKLKLGHGDLTIERAAFATFNKSVTLGWGSNPLGDFKLTPVGLRYTFHVKDFLSSKAIGGAEAASGIASAFANDQGEIVLTLDTKDDQDVNVTIKAAGYRNENLTVKATNKEALDVSMVPDRKHVFVSKRSGKLDVYKVDADGKNEKLLLAGTGSERDDMVLVPHPDRNMAALVSTRDNLHNVDSYLLSTLTLVNIDTGKTTSLGHSEKFQIIGWVGDRLIYAKIVSGPSAAKATRQRLISYDYVNNTSTEIASSNYFNDILLAQDKIYYAPSKTYQKGINIGLFEVDADGSNRKVLIASEIWNLFRTSYDEITITIGQAWYKYQIGSDQKPVALTGAPPNPKSRLYFASPDKGNSLWVDQRDGKGVLLAYNVGNKQDKNITSQSGLNYPVRWLNNSTVVYRVKNDQETADYVASLDDGQPKKLTDVTNISGITNWNNY